MGFADRYIHALSASNLKDDERHHQAEPLLAAAFAAAEVSGDLGPLLHRVKFAGTTARNMAHAAAAREREGWTISRQHRTPPFALTMEM